MKKKDLRTAIGGIKANDALIADTMDKIARYRTEQCESRGASHSKFGLGLRIAAAACAFALVVGVGLFVGLGQKTPDTVSDTDDQRTLDNNDTDTSDTYLNKKELTELSELADTLDGEWIIVRATVDSCMMSENGIALVGLTVGDLLACSDGFELDNESISAEFEPDTQELLDGIIESLTSERYFLISGERAGNEYHWVVEKYL